MAVPTSTIRSAIRCLRNPTRRGSWGPKFTSRQAVELGGSMGGGDGVGGTLDGLDGNREWLYVVDKDAEKASSSIE